MESIKIEVNATRSMLRGDASITIDANEEVFYMIFDRASGHLMPIKEIYNQLKPFQKSD